MEIVNLVELEALARARLPVSAFDYYASGADDEVTLRANREAFERLAVHYRVLVDVSRRTTATTVLGHPVTSPILVAPTAFHGMACAEGELATARAASAAGTIMTLSSLSNTNVEEVAKASTTPLFFQLYVYRDRGATTALVRRVEAAGAKDDVVDVRLRKALDSALLRGGRTDIGVDPGEKRQQCGGHGIHGGHVGNAGR
jgi:4-hydroxymandelate oxidase